MATTKEAVEVLVYKVENEGLAYAITDYGDLFDAVGLEHEREKAASALDELEAAIEALAAEYLDEDS